MTDENDSYYTSTCMCGACLLQIWMFSILTNTFTNF